MFELARGYKERGMAAYSELQQAEFASEKDGYSATRHQREVGTGYFDEVAQVYLVEHLQPQHLQVQPKLNNSKLLNNPYNQSLLLKRIEIKCHVYSVTHKFI